MSPADRKALTRQYKEGERPIGVFRVHNTVEDRSFVGASPDLPAMLNRQRFQLASGGHPNRRLQQDWNRLGAEAFAFEVLDTLERSEAPGWDPREDLRQLEQLWLEKLEAYGERGYNALPRSRG
jgi:hypothetical protein